MVPLLGMLGGTYHLEPSLRRWIWSEGLSWGWPAMTEASGRTLHMRGVWDDQHWSFLLGSERHMFSFFRHGIVSTRLENMLMIDQIDRSMRRFYVCTWVSGCVYRVFRLPTSCMFCGALDLVQLDVAWHSSGFLLISLINQVVCVFIPFLTG